MAFNCIIPAVPTIQRDDDDLRITRYDFAPGAVTGWHTHGWPYFITMLTDGVLRMHNGSEVSDTSLSAGQAYSRPAGVQHDVITDLTTRSPSWKSRSNGRRRCCSAPDHSARKHGWGGSIASANVKAAVCDRSVGRCLA